MLENQFGALVKKIKRISSTNYQRLQNFYVLRIIFLYK